MTEILDSKEIGDRIRQAREKAGMNRKELAEKLNLAASSVTRYERGEIERVKMPIIESIGKATGVNPAWLCGMVDEPEPKTYYISKETQELAQTMKENAELRILFDAAKDANPEDLKTVSDMLLLLKGRRNAD